MQQIRFEGFGGLSLVADAWGSESDPIVLLLHGAAQSRHMWRSAAEVLAEAGRYVIALDLRGHGESDWSADGRYEISLYVADLKAVLAQLSSRPAVVGTSLGGLVALAALGEGGGELASALILSDASPWLGTAISDELGAAIRRQAAGFGDVEEAAEAAVLLNPHRRGHIDLATLRERLVAGDDGRLHWRWDPATLGGVDREALAERLEKASAGVTIPTLVLRGGDSRVVTAADARRLAGLLRDVEMIEIEGASHLASSERADEFNAAIVDFLERRAPRLPLAYREGSDPRTLRDALGCFGTGVTIVTTLAQDGATPLGLTANSFSSVSLDPPLILFCLARSSNQLDAFAQATTFAINVLHIGQQLASNRFARKDMERFSAVPWETWDTGVPILSGSLASFECATHQVVDAGDHLIFIGRVLAARFEPRRDPLLYFRGKYRRLHFA